MFFHVIFCISVLLIAAIPGVVFLLRPLISSGKSENKERLKYELIIIFIAIIALVFWVVNVGQVLNWAIILFSFIFLPIIHTVEFVVINRISLSYLHESGKLKVYIILSFITFLLTYLLTTVDKNVGFSVLSPINNDAVLLTANKVALAAALGNAVLMILQIAEIRKIRKEIRDA